MPYKDINKRRACIRASLKRHRERYRETHNRWRRGNAVYQAKVRQQRKRSPQKYNIRRATTNAIASGLLVKRPCFVCGNQKVDAHHPDYSDHLNIQWMCRQHHLLFHDGGKRQGVATLDMFDKSV